MIDFATAHKKYVINQLLSPLPVVIFLEILAYTGKFNIEETFSHSLMARLAFYFLIYLVFFVTSVSFSSLFSKHYYILSYLHHFIVTPIKKEFKLEDLTLSDQQSNNLREDIRKVYSLIPDVFTGKPSPVHIHESLTDNKNIEIFFISTVKLPNILAIRISDMQKLDGPVLLNNFCKHKKLFNFWSTSIAVGVLYLALKILMTYLGDEIDEFNILNKQIIDIGIPGAWAVTHLPAMLYYYYFKSEFKYRLTNAGVSKRLMLVDLILNDSYDPNSQLVFESFYSIDEKTYFLFHFTKVFPGFSGPYSERSKKNLREFIELFSKVMRIIKSNI